jgi:hypothetical protein
VIFPVTIAALAVVVGTALGLALGHRAVVPAGIVAAVASLVAVFAQLLPEALHDLGWVALLAFAAALALPIVLEVGGRRLAPDSASALPLELAYGGLVAHQFADGVALGALASVAHDHGHEVSYVAIATHTVALSVLFALLFRARGGRHVAVVRGLGMVGALVAGAAGVGALPVGWIEAAHPWVIAAAGGLLVHVAAHPIVHAIAHRAAPATSSVSASSAGPGR